LRKGFQVNKGAAAGPAHIKIIGQSPLAGIRYDMIRHCDQPFAANSSIFRGKLCRNPGFLHNCNLEIQAPLSWWIASGLLLATAEKANNAPRK
jgi:hypothetical protein